MSSVRTLQARTFRLPCTHLSKKGNSSGAPGVLRQSRISSMDTANIDSTCTPAARMRSFASLAVLASNVPDASLLANTLYPSWMRDSARNAVHTLVIK